jgi:hypothetical protein
MRRSFHLRLEIAFEAQRLAGKQPSDAFATSRLRRRSLLTVRTNETQMNADERRSAAGSPDDRIAAASDGRTSSPLSAFIRVLIPFQNPPFY